MYQPTTINYFISFFVLRSSFFVFRFVSFRFVSTSNHNKIDQILLVKNKSINKYKSCNEWNKLPPNGVNAQRLSFFVWFSILHGFSHFSFIFVFSFFSFFHFSFFHFFIFHIFRFSFFIIFFIFLFFNRFDLIYFFSLFWGVQKWVKNPLS